MSDSTGASTLQVQGFTPYAQIPKWILRSQGKISGNAVQLYGVIMTYADNETRSAFPSRDKLAEDMGVSVASVKRYIKELEQFRALIVERRRNKRTGNFYANHYTLVFNSPWVTDDPPPSVTDDPITKPTNNYTQPSFTSDQRSDESVSRSNSVQAPTNPREYSPNNPGNLTSDQRWTLIKKLQIVGLAMQDGHKFYDEATQYAWDDFTGMLHEYADGDYRIEYLAYEIDNGKFTVGAKVADAYEAGKKLNTMLNTAGVM